MNAQRSEDSEAKASRYICSERDFDPSVQHFGDLRRPAPQVEVRAVTAAARRQREPEKGKGRGGGT